MFGFVSLTEKGGADRLLARLAAQIAETGVPVVAMVWADVPTARACEMHLRLLPGGQVRPISQDLGADADACSLDVGALEGVVAETSVALARAPQGTPLILNKFGKIEAGGHGCRQLIAEALETGHPVLISVPAQTRADFEAFAGDMAEELPPDPEALLDFLGLLPLADAKAV